MVKSAEMVVQLNHTNGKECKNGSTTNHTNGKRCRNGSTTKPH